VRNAAFASNPSLRDEYYGKKTIMTRAEYGYSDSGWEGTGINRKWHVVPAEYATVTDYSNYVGNTELDASLLAESKNRFLYKFDPSGKNNLDAGIAGYQAATTSIYKNLMTPEQQRAAVSTAANTSLAKISTDTGLSVGQLSKVLTKEATYGTREVLVRTENPGSSIFGPKTWNEKIVNERYELTPAEYAEITATTTKEQIAKIKSNYFNRIVEAQEGVKTYGLDSSYGTTLANLTKNADSFNTSIDALYSVAIGAAGANNPAINVKQLNADLAANIANAKVLEAAGNANSVLRGNLVGASVLAGGALAAGSMTAGGYTLSPTLTTVLGGNANNFITPITVNPITVGTPTGTIGAERRNTSEQLVVPTTNYVDNSSVTNINGSGGGGGGGVRDTYSHPILGSTERSISSTYNYNYLYR